MENTLNSPSSSRADRKTVEKNRRNQMKSLCSELRTLVTRHSSKETIPLPEQLHEATNYIKKLQIKLEKMRERKHTLMGIQNPASPTNHGASMSPKPPQIEIHSTGSALQVVLITNWDCHFMFRETLRMLDEEGVDVVNASFTVSEDAVFHTIHSMIESGAEVDRISQRLNNVFHCASSVLKYE